MSEAATSPLPATDDHVLSSWRRGFALYRAHPFRNAGRYFSFMARKLWPGRTIRFVDGEGNCFVSMKNNFTSFAVAVIGERDPNVMLFLRRWLRPGAIVLDVGANIGTYAIPIARIVGPSGRVVAFEPNRPTRACLRQNLRLNRIGHVTLVPHAVGAQVGRAQLVVTERNLGEVHLAPVKTAGGAHVSVTTLDAEVARLGLRRVDFIKIDVEGHELAALRGAQELLRCQPRLVVQTEIVPAHLARYGASPAALQEFFAALGYRPYRCDETGTMHPLDAATAADEPDWFWARSAEVLRT